MYRGSRYGSLEAPPSPAVGLAVLSRGARDSPVSLLLLSRVHACGVGVSGSLVALSSALGAPACAALIQLGGTRMALACAAVASSSVMQREEAHFDWLLASVFRSGLSPAGCHRARVGCRGSCARVG